MDADSELLNQEICFDPRLYFPLIRRKEEENTIRDVTNSEEENLVAWLMVYLSDETVVSSQLEDLFPLE